VDGVEGDRVSLSVAAEGPPPLSYQWSKDGQPIAGATAATLELAALAETDAGVELPEVNNRSETE